MAKNRQWLLSSRPTGEPTAENFELVETDAPTAGTREVLVRTEYLSVDPYMRGRMRDAESYAEPWAVGDPMKAGVVGSVVESEHPDFEAGDTVTGNLLWADYAVADGDDLRPVDPDRGPISTALGVLGMPGVTAYFGTTDVAEPTAGDTVVVSAAGGAVGSVVGQIAALSGCRVVGIAGADEKIEWIESIGFDAGINYETADVRERLRETCPDGVDVYFDNVGGPITDAVWPLLNVRSRVAVCGQISTYNATETPTGPRKLMQLIQSRARVEGFLVRDYESRWDEALDRLSGWIESGDLEYEENVVEGLKNAPEAFFGLFEGTNIGKQLVRVDRA
ncbi:NADP-dependent oxidoreductase [Natronomonas sp. F2-12]|jgi:NADPH-dependent curcumin reductase CurA|uniref:NADP-dependent oxidoreductase n=1 Tax=Natronomonas aquatica TaxID=2841590 RepID=A0A9R1CTF7_9EURY|nr:NADP-dependent oxidoreductase [Natronomonas aquatica]MCQ4333605.1 NADP-dependent oxidoreductase [Natronomonas aquatica]